MTMKADHATGEHATRMSDVQAVILCGGLGTRLRGAVPNLPKALAPVAGRPFLDYLLAGLAAAGVREVVLCTGHLSEKITAEYGRKLSCGLSVEYSAEAAPLGTAGALKHAAPVIRTNPFLVLNGDSLVELDFGRMLAAHLACGASATIVLTEVPSPERYGSVAVDPNGEVCGFAEKTYSTISGSACGPTTVNAGVYLLDRRLLAKIPEAPPAVSLERQVLPTWIGQGLFGFVTQGFFIDIGVPEEYQRAQIELPQRSSLAGSHSR
jgi:NDP-sugar pyrophosphorylase family protein